MDLDFVKNSHGLILECTFYEREHIQRARAGKHIHVDDLPELLAAIPDPQIMLIHVTRRTDLSTAKRILESVIGCADRERVSFLMDRPPRSARPRWSNISEPRARARGV